MLGSNNVSCCCRADDDEVHDGRNHNNHWLFGGHEEHAAHPLSDFFSMLKTMGYEKQSKNLLRITGSFHTLICLSIYFSAVVSLLTLIIAVIKPSTVLCL